jgi:HSP20 family molecular chaperone IbpA
LRQSLEKERDAMSHPCKPAKPDVTLTEGRDGYCVAVNLNGLSQQDVAIAVHGRLLTIEGAQSLHPSEDRDDSGNSYAGGFLYCIGLPVDADGSAHRATWNADALTITFDRFVYRRAA